MPDRSEQERMAARLNGIIDEDSPSFDAIVEALTRVPDVREPEVSALSKFYRVNGGPVMRPLSPRELEVVRYLSHGIGTGQVALLLKVGEATVRTHVMNARHKLAAKNKTHLIARALRTGLID